MTTNISSPWRLPVWDSSGPYLLRRTPGCSVEHKLDLFSLAVRDGSEHFKSTVAALAPQTEQRSLNPLLTRSIQGLSGKKSQRFLILSLILPGVTLMKAAVVPAVNGKWEVK